MRFFSSTLKFDPAVGVFMLYQIVFFLIHSFNKPVLWRDYIGFSRNMELLHTKPSFQPSHHLLKLSVPNLRFKCCLESLGIQRTTTCRSSIWIGKPCYHLTYGSYLLTSIQCSFSSSSELGDVNCTLPVHSLVWLYSRWLQQRLSLLCCGMNPFGKRWAPILIWRCDLPRTKLAAPMLVGIV